MSLPIAAPRRLIAALAASVVVLPGCGGDKDAPGRAVELGPRQPLEVRGDEYSFDPLTVTVAAPGTLAITLHNDGNLAHNLRLRRDGAEVGGTDTFQGGRAESIRVDLKAGSYEMVCTVGDHEALGMKGTLEVRAEGD